MLFVREMFATVTLWIGVVIFYNLEAIGLATICDRRVLGKIP